MWDLIVSVPDHCLSFYFASHFESVLHFNPYKPSVPLLGHRQTVQTQIRRHRTRRLIKVFTVCLQEYLFEI